jgi:hypothetical protein
MEMFRDFCGRIDNERKTGSMQSYFRDLVTWIANGFCILDDLACQSTMIVLSDTNFPAAGMTGLSAKK